MWVPWLNRVGALFVTVVLAAPASADTAPLSLTSTLPDRPSIAILQPEDGERLKASEPLVVRYHAVPGFKGEFVQLQLDDHEPVILDRMEGSHVVGPLQPGAHRIQLELLNRAHAELGVGISVDVEAVK